MNKKTKVNLLGFFTVFFWASAFPLSKIAMEHFAPNALGFIRCTVASVILLLIGRVSHIRRPFQRKDILWFILSGGMGFSLYMISFNMGVRLLTSATSSVIIATVPILTAVAAAWLYEEKINRTGWCCIGGAFVGVLILLLWDGHFSANAGLAWTIGASFVFCGYNILNRKLLSVGYTALEIVTYSMICGAVLLAGFSAQAAVQISSADPSQLLAVVYLGAMPSATAYFLWGKAMTLADKTSEVTNFMFVTPLLSTVMGFILLREVPNAGTLIGGAIIIGSIVAFNIKGK